MNLIIQEKNDPIKMDIYEVIVKEITIDKNNKENRKNLLTIW